MANVAHKNITGTDLHEPKGIAAAAINTLYVADGAASGSWTTAPKAGRWVLISSQTPAATATVNFTGFSSSVYQDYQIVLDHFIPATDDSSLWMRTSTDAGSTYDSGSTNYMYANNGRNTAGTTGATSNGDAKIVLTGAGVGNATGEFLSGIIRIINPGAAARCSVLWELFYHDATGRLTAVVGGGIRDAAADVDAARLLFSAGNITSGTAKFYGLGI